MHLLAVRQGDGNGKLNSAVSRILRRRLALRAQCNCADHNANSALCASARGGSDGNIKLNLRVDADLKDTINNIKHYTGEIQNRANIGMTDEEMKALWDAVHADDPLELE